MDINFNCPLCQKPMQPVRTGEVRKALEKRIGELEPYFQEAPVASPQV
ncbi:MAG: hypothetical protein LC620_08030 [Halobacteriales archaeon]|nr:hypothetical protein [Halobacteriales archaeon]